MPVSLKALQARSAEAARIDGLVSATKEKHADLWRRCVDWAAEVSDAQQPTALHYALITEANVENELTRAFAEGNLDECPIELLFEQMGLPLVSKLQDAVEEVLQGMEDDNKIMYREGVVHLI